MLYKEILQKKNKNRDTLKQKIEECLDNANPYKMEECVNNEDNDEK